VEQILTWADAHHTAHGAWPAVSPGSLAGEVPGAPGESWKAINVALAMGLRGLPGDSSLAELLAEHRGLPLPDMRAPALAEKIWAWEREHFPIKRPRIALKAKRACPPLSAEQILAWADAHHAATGKWPGPSAGPVRDAPFPLTWSNVDDALQYGRRGLPAGSRLSDLLAERRQVRKRYGNPPLTLEEILAWADAHHAATGRWPNNESGPVRNAPFAVTWSAIQSALQTGQRGLPRGTTLPRLLAEHGLAPYRLDPEPISVEQILAWADAHHAATGKWPGTSAGPVRDAPFPLTWSKVDCALQFGRRGLPGGSRLTELLAERRQVPKRYGNGPLTVEQILAWADAHRAATGEWPRSTSGLVGAAPYPLTWQSIQDALQNGIRGLPGGSSLSRLLTEQRNVRRRLPVPGLSVEQILAWADAHHAATGAWPNDRSGAVRCAPSRLTWGAIQHALRCGYRGLPGGMSLLRLLTEHGRRAPRLPVEPLSTDQILAWADAHHAATGKWPGHLSGPVQAAPFPVTWCAIAGALRKGSRRLPGGTTLPRLIAEHRRNCT
jgi:hypothetical protein